MPNDETTSTEPTATVITQVEAAQPPAPEVKNFTQEQVNAIVQKRLADDRAARSAPTAPKAAEPKAEKPVERMSNSELHAEIEQIKLRSAFEKRTAKFDLEDSKSEALFKIYKADPSGFDEAVSMFGIKATTPTPTQSVTAVAAPEPKTPPAAPSAPSGHSLPTQNGLTDLFAMSPVQLDQLGPSGVRTALEQIWKIGNQRSGAPTRPMPPTRK